MKKLAWFGTVSSVLGSFCVALQHFQIGYVCFTLGSLAWLTVAMARKDRALGALNGTFFIANILGLYTNFV